MVCGAGSADKCRNTDCIDCAFCAKQNRAATSCHPSDEAAFCAVIAPPVAKQPTCEAELIRLCSASRTTHQGDITSCLSCAGSTHKATIMGQAKCQNAQVTRFCQGDSCLPALQKCNATIWPSLGAAPFSCSSCKLLAQCVAADPSAHCQGQEIKDFCDASTCDANVCGAEGHCDVGRGVCACDAGVTGARCETNPCSANDCDGHGSCTWSAATGDSSCKCDPGYSGSKCTTGPCTGYDCGVHGKCLVGGAEDTKGHVHLEHDIKPFCHCEGWGAPYGTIDNIYVSSSLQSKQYYMRAVSCTLSLLSDRTELSRPVFVRAILVS